MADKIIEFDRVVAGYSPEPHDPERDDARRAPRRDHAADRPRTAGKSTVLKTLFGLLTPRSGEVRFEGKVINGPAARAARRGHRVRAAGSRNLFGSLSVRHNLELGGITLPRGELLPRASRKCSCASRIRERIDNQASTLSGGEQKQLEVGRARCCVRACC